MLRLILLILTLFSITITEGCKENEVTTTSGLKYIEVKEGTGPSPEKGKVVIVHYRAALMDGKKYDSSVDRNGPFEFTIGAGEVIQGWDEGMISMKTGGKRKLIIPPELAYGIEGAGGVIPPNAIIIIEVELLSVK